MTEKLKDYNQKRNFEKTFEPEGIVANSKEGLRFVVQYHEASRKHYDLRLEWEGVLLSWAVPKGPSYNTSNKRLAVHVEDHPLSYRNFEGTIPKGEYGGGVVMIWDEGYWQPFGNVEEGLAKGELKFTLKGKRLKGNWALIRWKAKSNEKVDNWLLLKEKDQYAMDEDGISKFTTSIRTGRTMKEIERGEEEKINRNPFNNVSIQLAKLANRVPEGEDWLCELKYDGYRIIAFVEGKKVRLISRNNNDYTKKFPKIATSIMSWAKRAMVLDGEIVVTDQEGKSDFQALQNYMKNPQDQNLNYVVFDILALDGEDLRGYPLIKRKEILENLLKDPLPNLHYSRPVKGNIKESFQVACNLNMEGIIVKKAESIYRGERNDDWLKLKCSKRQEFIIGGYTLSNKRTSGISSLLLGFYEGEDLIYAGRAGTGISMKDMEILEEKFANLKRLNPPFKLPPKERSNENITWLEPEIVAEINFAQWTKDNLLRQASYKGLRTDKNPKEVEREDQKEDEYNEQPPLTKEAKPTVKAGDLIIEGIKITNPDRLVFDDPKITKEDVVRYYLNISERMLPYLGNRILSIVRCPKGVGETCFYKKHPGPNSQGIITIPISTASGKTEDYFYIDSISGLISEAQMGTLEFHIWGSTVKNLEKPDMLVFDLDPDEGMDLSIVRQGVVDIKEILDELSLNSYLKTSGGKGYHLVVPLEPSVNWNVSYDFAKGVVQVMEKKWPDRYTSNVRKASRKGKIFIDWIRNGRGATSIAPYSLRARKGAKVSMPIAWEELNTVAPDGINMQEALLRVKKDDPWEDFFHNDQRLK
ncbi:MAG: DNA ligase D [Tissierellia bacterium]|nr:DNA ligase D [Tissierellia bacterium]